MKMLINRKNYKSPQRKLVKFFEKSRDQWKAKCRKAKAQVKYLKNRVRTLERSREHWKQRAQLLEAKLARVQDETKARQDVKPSCQHPPRIIWVEIPHTKGKITSTTS